MALRTSSGGSSGPRHDFDALEAEGASFLPDRALSEAARVLRRPASLNFEIFRALVFSGGRASSGQIKESLMARGVTLPSSGETLEDCRYRIFLLAPIIWCARGWPMQTAAGVSLRRRLDARPSARTGPRSGASFCGRL